MKNAVTDRSSMRRYRTEIPNLVLEMDLSVYAFRLYVQLKRVAGDDGKCFYTTRQLAEQCRMGVGTVVNARKELVGAGLLLEIVGVTPESAVAILKTKSPQKISIPSIPLLTCSWCGSVTICLDAHHYPVARKDGGTKTVAICASCHREYHTLIEPRYEMTPLALGEE